MKHPALLLLALTAVLLTAAAPTAQATIGSYAVSSCNFAEGINHSWSWSSSDPTSPDHYEKHESCPDRIGSNGGRTDQEGGLSTTDALGLSNGASPDTSAGWSFKAPPGTTIAGITYERYIGHELDSSNYWVPALRADGTIVPGESCLDTPQNQWSCYIGGPPNEGGETKTITGLSAHELTLGINCLAHTEEQCITGAKLHKAWAATYGATVTINDPTPPTLTTPTGPLWEPTTYKKGDQTVTAAAEDIGGGVATIQLAVDGHVLESYNPACNYAYPQPCPAGTGPQTLTLPTTELTDGTHTVTLTATDAARNQSPAISEQIDVENNPPPAPLDLTTTTPPPGTYTFTATWTNPPNLTAPITGQTYQICSAESPYTCQEAVTMPKSEIASITVPGPGTWTLALWLTNDAGNSSRTNAAHITLHSQPTNLVNPASGPAQTPTGSPLSGPLPNSTALPLTERLRVHASRHGNKLVVSVRSPSSGKLRLTLTARYRGRIVVAKSVTRWTHSACVSVTFHLQRQAIPSTILTLVVQHDYERVKLQISHG